MDTALTVVMIAAGVVVIIGGWPMAAGRVRPNGWYGYRTAASLKNQAVWNVTNRVAGRWLVAVGVLVIAAMMALRMADVPAGVAALITAGVLAVGVLLCGLRAWFVERAFVKHVLPEKQ